MLLLAAEIALPTDYTLDKRGFWLGCVGIRQDGTKICSQNGAVCSSSIVENYQLIPESHAEGRALRKMDRGGVLYVARVKKQDRSLAMSMCCGMCATQIKSAGIKKVYYTISNNQYGIWWVKKDYHIIHDC